MVAKVLVDANVLFSRTLRDWVLQLSLQGGMYRGYRTEDVGAEAFYHLRRKYPHLNGGVLTAFRTKLETCLTPIPEYPILSDYPGGDPHDAHLHSAAVAGGMGYVLTTDELFATAAADRDDLPYEAYLPDAFLVLVDDSSPTMVRAVTEGQSTHQVREYGECHLVEKLKKAKCPDFAERVRGHLQGLY